MSIAELRTYIQPMLKWWWLILLTTVVATMSSFLFLASQPPIYQSQSTIMVGSGVQNPNPNNTQFGLAEQLSQAYSDIAQRAPIRQATMEALGLDVLPTYVVKVVPNSPLIEIVVTDADPHAAYVVAQELVNQLILQGPAGQAEQERQQFIIEQLAKLEVGITETEDEIVRKQDDLAGMFGAREIANTQDQIFALQNKLSSLRTNYSSLLANSQQNATNRITVLEPAALPLRPLPQSLVLSLLMAAMVGFVLGAGGAYLLEFLDDSIKSGDEVRKALSISLMASIPAFDRDEQLITFNETPSAVTEAYRSLRTNLQYVGLIQPVHALVMTGPAPHDGKSITTANLCITLAHSGKRVILVDADLHRPKQHWLFQTSNTMGLTSLLMDNTLELDIVLQQSNVPNLQILTSGQLPPNPAELLGSARMRALLDKLKAQADIVIMDTPPLTAVVDATVLATQVDGVLVILRAEKTSIELAKRVLHDLRQVNAPILGAILNGVSRKNSTYSHSAYGYGIHTKAQKRVTRRNPFSLLGKRSKEEASGANYALNGHPHDPAKDHRVV
jgi:capsular exopolysaccharide synthesis family protein